MLLEKLAGVGIFAFVALQWHVAQAVANRAEEHDHEQKNSQAAG